MSVPRAPGPRRSVRLRLSDRIAEIVPDPVRGGWALELGGLEQSHVDLADPTRLTHEYLARMARMLDACWPPGRPISVIHLGGGALTLARYVQATRPGSAQIAVEIESELPTFVIDALPLPQGTRLEVEIGDARERLARRIEEHFDAVVLDVYSGEASPKHLTGSEFFREALGHVAEDGLLLVNVGDDAGQRFVARQIRALDTASAQLGHAGTWTLTDATLLTRPSDGNMVLAAGPALASPRIEEMRAAWLAAGPHPAAVLDPQESVAFADSRLRSADRTA